MDEDGDGDDDDDDDDDPPLVGRMLCKYILRSNHQPTGGWNTAPMVSANTSVNWNSGAQKVSNLNHVSWCFLRIFGSGWSDGTLVCRHLAVEILQNIAEARCHVARHSDSSGRWRKWWHWPNFCHEPPPASTKPAATVLKMLKKWKGQRETKPWC